MRTLPFLLLLACHGGKPSLEDCATPECKRQVLADLWKDDPAALQKTLAGLDPITQAAYVNALTDQFPGQTEALCKLLPKGSGRDRCDRISHRPHLRSGNAVGARAPTVSQGDVATPGSGGDADVHKGPGMTLLLPSKPEAFATSPWDTVPPVDPPCADVLSATTCRATAADKAARAGDVAGAAAACYGNPAGQWRWECLFDAAETVVHNLPPEQLDQGLSLCIGAGDYRANCFAHAIMVVAQRAPASTNGVDGAWGPILQAVPVVERTVSDRDEDLAQRLGERLWAEATVYAYAKATRVTGDPLDVLPPEAAPHVRAAAAARLVANLPNEQLTFQGWSDRLAAALALRARDPGDPRGAPARPEPAASAWTELYPGEEALTQVLYLGQAKRALSADPVADAQICLLEALGRRPRPPLPVFVDALDSPDQAVRWTAARWLQALGNGSYDARLLASADPLVRGRGTKQAKAQAPTPGADAPTPGADAPTAGANAPPK